MERVEDDSPDEGADLGGEEVEVLLGSEGDEGGVGD